jgi:hypothetical protein
MDRVITKTHPEYLQRLIADPTSRPARIEIDARGQTFVGERQYAKGTPSADPTISMSTPELVEKFRTNADGVIASTAVEDLIAMILNLETVRNIGDLTALLRPRS